ncbi:hypothetical protein BT93_H1652 [Corymbia citriodora subsp. variegata]|nr:hypothetical protein BT93_H1652 [Corymbia citriodora subsp. variegata]KAF8016211.1 hypothetical protein BT93_H1652 [Corymbia citriodora subsp. variegata]
MAQQRSQLPTFGNWENGDSIPYTDYFEKARKGKGHAKRNPNGVQSDYETNITSEPSETFSIQKEVDLGLQKVAEPEAAILKHKHYRNGGEADQRRLIVSPPHRGATGGRTASGACRPYNSGVRKPKTEAEQVMKGQDARWRSLQHRIRVEEVDRPRRRLSDTTLHRDARYGRAAAELPVRQGGMISCRSPSRSVWQNPRSVHIESPSHHTQHQASVGGRGGRMSSPVREKRYSSTSCGHSAAPMTPGRSHLKSVARGDKTLEKPSLGSFCVIMSLPH